MTNPSRTTLCQVFFFFFATALTYTGIKQPPKVPAISKEAAGKKMVFYSSAIMGKEKILGMRLPSFF